MPRPARTWVGLWPSTAVVDALTALPREQQPGVRWTTPDQWHVTLRFLGTVDADEVARTLAPLRHDAVEVTLGPRVGRLGRHLLVVPAEGCDGLVAAVDQLLDPLVGPRAGRFLGHLTLARLKQRPACGLVHHPIDTTWWADRVAVVTSELDPAGARYHTLAEIPLGASSWP